MNHRPAKPIPASPANRGLADLIAELRPKVPPMNVREVMRELRK